MADGSTRRLAFADLLVVGQTAIAAAVDIAAVVHKDS